MLSINVEIIPERWDEEKQEFIEPEYETLNLEHSLLSLSKWESKWNKAFLGKKDKTDEETLDYIKCMTINNDVSDEIYKKLSEANIRQIDEYIKAPMTATCISNNGSGGGSREQTTSELIYYWMISLNIPFECETWHLNRLLTLIRVCSIKNEPPKKMSKREIMNRNASLNAQRRKNLNTKG